MSNLRDRLLAAITATPPEKRGYVLREASVRNTTMSLTDLLTDLAPFVEAEIAAAVRAEAADAHALLDKAGVLTHMIGTGSIENQRATLAERIHDLHCMAAKDAADLRAEIVRLNADLARLGALKTEEVAGVLDRFRAAFGVNVPPVPHGALCSGKRCEGSGARCEGQLVAAMAANEEAAEREAINRERWAQTFPAVPWIDDAQDRTNYLLNERDRASGKTET